LLAVPLKVALIVAGSAILTSPPPVLAVPAPELVPSVIMKVVEGPQVAVVIFAVPLKEVPLIVLAVFNFVALAAFPLILLAKVALH